MYATGEMSLLIQDLLRREKFVPIEVVVADGRVVKIENREQAWVESSLLFVASMKAHEVPLTEIIALRHIALVRVRDELVPKSDDEIPF